MTSNSNVPSAEDCTSKPQIRINVCKDLSHSALGLRSASAIPFGRFDTNATIEDDIPRRRSFAVPGAHHFV